MNRHSGKMVIKQEPFHNERAFFKMKGLIYLGRLYSSIFL